jgi:hypothetical protein
MIDIRDTEKPAARVVDKALLALNRPCVPRSPTRRGPPGLLQRVVSARVKRMAFANPDQGEAHPFRHPILLYGLAGVDGTGGVEATGGRDKG